jgi:hypothetical protein
LLFAPVNFGSNNFATPPYVMTALGTDIVDCYVPANPNANPPTLASGESNVPMFWEQPFGDRYNAFVDAAIAKYGDDSDIGYIRFGMSNGAQSGTTVCFDALLGKGLTEPIWDSYITAIATHVAGATHHTQLVLGLGPFGVPNDPNYPNYSVTDFPDWEATLAASTLGLGIGNQGLDKNDEMDHANHIACAGADWCANFDRYRGVVPLYLQQIGDSCPDDSCLTGSLASILPFGLAEGAQIFEVYDSDLTIAYDNDPNDPKALAAYNSGEGIAYRALFAMLAQTLGVAPMP